MTIEQRHAQIRNISLSREALIEAIPGLNLATIANDTFDEKLIKSLLAERIQGYSVDDIKNIIIKLHQFGSVGIAQNISLVNQFYALMIHMVLLPNYLDGSSLEVKTEELKEIIERYMNRLDKKIERIKQQPFHIMLGDKDELTEEIERVGGISGRSFRPWGPFGANYIGYDEESEGHTISIPIMLAKAEGSTIVNTINPETIKKIVFSIVPKKNKSEKKNKTGRKNIGENTENDLENIYSQFEATFETKVDKDTEYGNIKNMTYLVINIKNPMIGELSTAVGYTPQEIIDHLEIFIELNNLLVNAIAKETGTNGEVLYNSFTVTTPYLFKSAQESAVVDMTKFSKLMVHMKEKVYLKDVAGQKRAKEEVASIVKTLKHPDVMKSWGAKPTSGIIFYGPPGTGKTLLAMVIATEVDAEVYNIKMTDIATNAYINTGANSIKELFEFIRVKAQKNPGKHIIVILDEMDALLKKRDGGGDQSSEDRKVVNTFLAEMSGFDTKGNVMFIGTTNNYDSLDSAVVRSGRFSTKVKVDLPDQEGRIEAFRIHTEKAKNRAERRDIFMPDIDLSILAQESDGLSPADIEESINSIVRKRAVKESDDIENVAFKTAITMEEIIDSIKYLKTSNGKTNQLLKSFSPEELQKLPQDQQSYVRDAIGHILLESHIKELREAVQSGKITTGSLQSVVDGFNSKKGVMGFGSGK